VLDPERLPKVIATIATRSAELLVVSEKIQAYRRWNRAANESISAILRTLMPVDTCTGYPNEIFKPI